MNSDIRKNDLDIPGAGREGQLACVKVTPQSILSKGFTLVELLVVISIIGLLAGLGIPAVKRGLDAGHSAKCLNNLKQMSVGFERFAVENNGYIPKAWANDGPALGASGWGYPANQYSGWDRVVADYLEMGTVKADGTRTFTEKTASIFRCPADKSGGIFKTVNSGSDQGEIPGSYRYNASNLQDGFLTAIKPIQLSFPAKSILVCEGIFKNYHHVATTDVSASGRISRTFTNNVACARHSGLANYLFLDGHVERLKWAETWDSTPPGVDPSWGLWRQR